jgi:hypothetical protein
MHWLYSNYRQWSKCNSTRQDMSPCNFLIGTDPRDRRTQELVLGPPELVLGPPELVLGPPELVLGPPELG